MRNTLTLQTSQISSNWVLQTSKTTPKLLLQSVNLLSPKTLRADLRNNFSSFTTLKQQKKQKKKGKQISPVKNHTSHVQLIPGLNVSWEEGETFNTAKLSNKISITRQSFAIKLPLVNRSPAKNYLQTNKKATEKRGHVSQITLISTQIICLTVFFSRLGLTRFCWLIITPHTPPFFRNATCRSILLLSPIFRGGPLLERVALHIHGTHTHTEYRLKSRVWLYFFTV